MSNNQGIMTRIEYEDLTTKVIDKVKSIAGFVKAEYSKLSFADVRLKNKNDLVSYVDEETEKMLISELTSLLPGSNCMAEESAGSYNTRQDEYYWIIDPIDGTTNFVYKIPVFCMSIALYRNDEVLLGVVYDPMHDEVFYSWKGAKSFLNGKVIQVNTTPKLEDALLATGFPYNRYDQLDTIIRILKEFLLNSQDVRRLGAAALDLCYVAAGRFDGFWEFQLKPWDVAAASLIVENAGGKVSGFKEGADFLFTGEIVAGVPAIREQMLEVINSL